MALVHTLEYWNGAEFDWRRVQSASDLKALALPHAPVLIAAMIAAGGPAALVTDRIADFLDRPFLTLDPDNGPPVRVWLEAALTTTEGPAALPALAALLAAAVLDLRDAPDLAIHWERLHSVLVALNAPVRAAFFNGFRDLMINVDLRLDPALETDFLLSRPTDSACAPLQAIAANATAAELLAIAMADYGNDADQHLQRLNEVIGSEGCVIPRTDSWHPLEVVQLVSHVPGQAGWLIATAVVLVTALRHDDCWGDGEYRWFKQADVYRALEPHSRSVLLAAVRHLYQLDIDFGLTARYQTAGAGPASLLPPEPGAELVPDPGLSHRAAIAI